MKGKMTRKKPNPIRLEVMEFPPEIIEQIRDLIFVENANGMAMGHSLVIPILSL